MILGLALAAPAFGASVTFEGNHGNPPGNTYFYDAGAGEANRLAVSESTGRITFRDPGAVVNGDHNCRQEGDASTVSCETGPDGSGSWYLVVRLGDRDDEVTLLLNEGSDALFDERPYHLAAVVVSGGAGNDILRGSGFGDWLDGGPGHDVLAAGAGPDFFEGGTGNDGLDGGTGDDWVYPRALGDGGGAPDADIVRGGQGNDFVQYGHDLTTKASDGRAAMETRPVHVTADQTANDGIAGEGDDIGADLEWVETGAGDDYVEAGGALARVYGGSGNDRLQAGPGWDQLGGGHGDDSLIGSPDPDALAGNEGNDQIVGGAGRDTLTGWTGDDVIDSRDPGAPLTADYPYLDWVMCDEGHDELYPDASDWQSVAPSDGCEVVHTPAGRTSQLHQDDPAFNRALGRLGTIEKGAVGLRLRCPGGGDSCNGRLTLTTEVATPARKGSRSSARSKRKLKLATGRVSVEAGRSIVVKIPLTRRGRALARRVSRIGARATLVRSTASGDPTATRRVRLRVRRASP